MHTKKFSKKIGLKYVSDDQPGIQRRRSGKNFYYTDAKGKKIKSKQTLERIKKIVIPPAWEQVWICTAADGHIQATGRDARGRKQYKYHTDWSEASNHKKFSKISDFGSMIGKLRKKVSSDLKKKGMPKEKIVAAVVKLMEITNFRVGNATYAKENNSYGLTTIKNSHAKVRGNKISFSFKGKSGVINTTSLEDPRLSKIVKRCQELPGQELFGYKDEDGKAIDITSDDVNAYIRDVSGDGLSAKDLRTWSASSHAINILLQRKDILELSETAWKKCQKEIIEETAAALSNTVAVCRKYYVHPEVFKAARSGSLFKAKAKKSGLKKSEAILLQLV